MNEKRRFSFITTVRETLSHWSGSLLLLGQLFLYKIKAVYLSSLCVFQVEFITFSLLLQAIHSAMLKLAISSTPINDCTSFSLHSHEYHIALNYFSYYLRHFPVSSAHIVVLAFISWWQEAVHQTVSVIFEDPGVQELLAKLYQKDWLEALVSEYLVETFDDYFSDVKMYIEERSFRRFVEACLEETVVLYVDHLLTQRNYIKEETIERMRLDEEVLMDFFREYINVSVSNNPILLISSQLEAYHNPLILTPLS
ncbi:hypothetical protein IFM89_026815 [Coptis chinensis]|uniref:Exocyst complex component Sec6 n=1 Tax=Coptis chinensis TaxID=261450 RepID=A0A835IFA0_9MAGN|nr:hypothetical protein IFM89_026815 [Coptis chinensis]